MSNPPANSKRASRADHLARLMATKPLSIINVRKVLHRANLVMGLFNDK